MAKKIQHVSELPEWYVLANYDGARHLTLVEWLEQLFVRRDIWMRVGSPATERQQASHTGKSTAKIILALPMIRAKPIVDIMQNPFLKDCFYNGSLRELREGNPIYSLGIHDTTIRDLYETERNITDKDIRDEARKYFDYLSAAGLQPREPFSYTNGDWMDVSVDSVSHLPTTKRNVRINLAVSDNLLTEQFLQDLKRLRAPLIAEGRSIRNWRKPNFSSWSGFGVLPYMDLQAWARENNKLLPNRVAADAIFPAGEGGEEIVRKTTSKLAKELIEWSHLETLVALAAQEKAERNSD